MNLGIITYIADDNSHGYLFKLDKIEEKYIFDVIKRNNIVESLYIKLNGKEIGLQKYQLVYFSEKLDNRGRKLAKIESSYFRAVAEKENSKYRITILEFENEIYILEASNKEFGETETGVVIFQLLAKIGKYSADFTFDKIITQFKGEGNTAFWLDKFTNLSVSYNEKLKSLFDTIFESIIKFLQSQFYEEFDLNKLLSKAVLKIKENCTEYEYNSLTYFIRCWKEKYPDFFRYSELSKILTPDIQLKTELWVLELYSFEEIFTDKNQITNEAIDYAITQDEDWLHDFLLKLKSIEAPTEQIQKVLFNSIPKELPQDFENLNTELVFITTNFPEL